MSADLIKRAQSIAPEALDPSPVRRASAFLGWGVGIAAVVGCAASLDVDAAVFGKGFDNLGRFLTLMAQPTDGGLAHRIYAALAQTFALAILATAIAAAIAAPLGLLGARTVLRNPVLHGLYRRILDVFRGVPSLVWALILVSALGLGPLPGLIALALADIPNLAKLFAEAIENADARQKEGVRATGAGESFVWRFGLLPQVSPILASQTLFFLEANFRNAAVLGIVGAGGIGLELEERIRVFAFDQVAYILIIYIICVMALDTISAALRRRLV